jgi:hypothetical protein
VCPSVSAISQVLISSILFPFQQQVDPKTASGQRGVLGPAAAWPAGPDPERNAAAGRSRSTRRPAGCPAPTTTVSRPFSAASKRHARKVKSTRLLRLKVSFEKQFLVCSVYFVFLLTFHYVYCIEFWANGLWVVNVLTTWSRYCKWQFRKYFNNL